MVAAARKWDGPASRARIVSAAEALFAEYGFAGASLRDIGRAVDMPNASLLHHFPTKRRLYAAVLDNIADSLGEVTGAVEAARARPRERLRTLCEALLDWHARHPEYARLVVRELADNPSRAESAGRWYLAEPVRRLAEIVAEAQAEGTVRPGEPMLLLFHVLGALSYTAVALPTLAGIVGESVDEIAARFRDQAWPMVEGALTATGEDGHAA